MYYTFILCDRVNTVFVFTFPFLSGCEGVAENDRVEDSLKKNVVE